MTHRTFLSKHQFDTDLRNLWIELVVNIERVRVLLASDTEAVKGRGYEGLKFFYETAKAACDATGGELKIARLYETNPGRAEAQMIGLQDRNRSLAYAIINYYEFSGKV